MIIKGTVNIMGMREIIFRHNFYCEIDSDNNIVRYIRKKLTERGEFMWFRVDKRDVKDESFRRTDEEMISSVKALALNPTVNLTFNGETMYVAFLNSE